MIKEYFRLIVLIHECQQEFDNLNVQKNALFDQIIAEYQSDSVDDVLVEVEDRYYLVNGYGIRLVNLVKSRDA